MSKLKAKNMNDAWKKLYETEMVKQNWLRPKRARKKKKPQEVSSVNCGKLLHLARHLAYFILFS